MLSCLQTQQPSIFIVLNSSWPFFGFLSHTVRERINVTNWADWEAAEHAPPPPPRPGKCHSDKDETNRVLPCFFFSITADFLLSTSNSPLFHSQHPFLLASGPLNSSWPPPPPSSFLPYFYFTFTHVDILYAWIAAELPVLAKPKHTERAPQSIIETQSDSQTFILPSFNVLFLYI